MTLRTGLRTSSNRAAVRLLQEIGIPRAVQYAQTMGVGDVPSVPSLALGSGEVTLASMTAAYAAFANQGRVPKPIVIRRVEDRDGRLLYRGAAVVGPRHQRDHGVPDVQHAGRRHQRRHRRGGEKARLQAAGGGKDRHDQRLQRRVVHRLSRRSSSRACGSASISRGRFFQTGLRRTSRFRSGRRS